MCSRQPRVFARTPLAGGPVRNRINRSCCRSGRRLISVEHTDHDLSSNPDAVFSFDHWAGNDREPACGAIAGDIRAYAQASDVPVGRPPATGTSSNRALPLACPPSVIEAEMWKEENPTLDSTAPLPLTRPTGGSARAAAASVAVTAKITGRGMTSPQPARVATVGAGVGA